MMINRCLCGAALGGFVGDFTGFAEQFLGVALFECAHSQHHWFEPGLPSRNAARGKLALVLRPAKGLAGCCVPHESMLAWVLSVALTRALGFNRVSMPRGKLPPRVRIIVVAFGAQQGWRMLDDCVRADSVVPGGASAAATAVWMIKL